MKKREVCGFRALIAGSVSGITVAVALSVATPSVARAAASYDGVAELVLTITDISGGTDPSALFISGGEDGSNSNVGTTGAGAVANAEAIAAPAAGTTLAVGDTISVNAAVSGTTGAVPSSASSLGQVSALIDIFNFSDTETFTVDFSYSYKQTVSATVMDPARETAFVNSLVEILADSLLPGDSLLTSFLVATAPGSSDPDIDEGGTFSLTFAPLDSDTIRLSAASEGNAAVVPLPPAALLLLSGLAAFAAPALRRRA